MQCTMPARSVAFANLRGGCGKSTILFQLASEFAKVRRTARGSRSRRLGVMQAAPNLLPSLPPITQHNITHQAHASTGVLVIDCTAFGDVSRLLLGGRQPHAKAAVAEQHSDGRSTAHLLSQLLPPAAAAAAVDPSAPLTTGRPVVDSAGARGAASWAAASEAGGADIAERFGLPVSQARRCRGGWLARAAAPRVQGAGCRVAALRACLALLSCPPEACTSSPSSQRRRSTRTSRCPTCC